LLLEEKQKEEEAKEMEGGEEDTGRGLAKSLTLWNGVSMIVG
jgi:hypothetical protein